MRRSRLQLLHSQLPSTIAGSVSTGFLVSILLDSLDATLPVRAWFTALAAISLVRVGQVLLHRRAARAHANGGRWRMSYTFSNLVAGCIWGSLMWVPNLADIRQAAAVIVVLGGIMGTASVLYAASLRAFLAFTLPVMAAMLTVVASHPALGSFIPFLIA